ncbi:MAG: branched-chain amino acid ABC transporter substrate-binding protein [Anaerolineae bacterium]|nr:branched-chain amino acid ABC transporter substrate-binding protein [Anaerolineae bacterium]
MHTNRQSSFLPLVITCLFVASCSARPTTGSSNTDDAWGTLTIRPGDKIRIGIAISNPDDGEGLEMVRGIELAIQHHQNIAGFPIEAVQIATECSADGGEKAAVELTNDDRIVGVIGPDCSEACQTAIPIFDAAHYTTISPSCGARELSDTVLHIKTFTRTIFPDADEGHLAARYAYNVLGARQVVLIDDGSINTTDFTLAFAAQFVSLGGKIVKHIAISPDQQNISSELEDIDTNNTDLLYAPLLPAEAANFVIQRRELLNLSSIPVLGGRHYWGNWFLQATKGKAEGIYAVGPYPTSSAYEEATIGYQNQYAQSPAGATYAYTYDAVSLLVNTLNKVASSNSQGELLIGRKKLQEELYKTTSYPGLTGDLTCTTWGDCGVNNLAVGQVQISRWVVVFIP